MNVPKKILDANVILRFFLEDHGEQFQKAREFFSRLERKEAEALLTEIVFAEVIWVLQKVYGIPRPDISLNLKKLVNYSGLKTVFGKEIFSEALDLYAVHAIDIQDLYLAVLGKNKGSTIVTFDKTDFKKIKADYSEP